MELQIINSNIGYTGTLLNNILLITVLAIGLVTSMLLAVKNKGAFFSIIIITLVLFIFFLFFPNATHHSSFLARPYIQYEFTTTDPNFSPNNFKNAQAIDESRNLIISFNEAAQ